MAIPEVHSPDQADPTGGDRGEDDRGEEQYSPAFAAWALLLTLGLLAGAITAVWVSAGWPVSAP